MSEPSTRAAGVAVTDRRALLELRTLTMRFTGRFKDDPAEQVRFLTMIGSGKA